MNTGPRLTATPGGLESLTNSRAEQSHRSSGVGYTLPQSPHGRLEACAFKGGHA